MYVCVCVWAIFICKCIVKFHAESNEVMILRMDYQSWYTIVANYKLITIFCLNKAIRASFLYSPGIPMAFDGRKDDKHNQSSIVSF